MKTKYKVGDIITLKVYEELLKEKIIISSNGFILKDGLFIQKNMYKYLGKKYKIIYVGEFDSNRFILDLKNKETWYWSTECFKGEEKQLEFNF